MKDITLCTSGRIRHVHMIGIGGSSMNGLAQILLNFGYTVSGSDMKSSAITDKLQSMGISFTPYHAAENVEGSNLVVYTAAVKESNPEYIAAKQSGIPIIDRAELLGQIMRKYPYSIAISGTHGKTTTTSMASMIILESGKDPTIHIGGELDAIGGSTRIGNGKYFITEACEYVESFTKFYPYLGVILNIEADHLDYFKDLNHIKSAFLKFARLIPEDGFLVVCSDDTNAKSIADAVKCSIISYSINSRAADWTAGDIEFNDMGCASFNIYHEENLLLTVELKVPGIHNVYNALAAAAACYTLGIDEKSIKSGLEKFTGTRRRFELKGVVNNIRVVDDYAHHPSEIVATLNAARKNKCNSIWCVFQPHTYTRTKALLAEFSKAFDNADSVIIADIYAAREVDNGEIHSRMLAEKLVDNGRNAVYFPDFDSIVNYLGRNVLPGDLILTMGAGDIHKVGEMFLMNNQKMAVF